MTVHELMDDLVCFIEGAHRGSQRPRTLHCARVLRSVPGPTPGDLAAVSVRHEIPLVSRAPEAFIVELWDLVPGELGDADAVQMCARLATYRAWYDELLEEAEFEGRRRRHRFSVHGNLVGRGVRASPLVDLLSLRGREVAFWTYRAEMGRAEFDPYVAEERPATRSPLRTMLGDLPWAPPPLEIGAPDDALKDGRMGSGRGPRG